ncbi:MAG: fibronectin type III domain-containing protein [Isosphaeraceae bacterium]
MRKHSFIPACGPLEDRVMLSATPTYTLKALSDTTVQVSWTKVPGAAGYWVDMYKGSWITIAKLGSTATSFTVDNLTPGATYTFDVAHLVGTSQDWENVQTIILPPAPPPAPTAPIWHATVASASQIYLSWNQVPNATSYVVEEFTAKGWSVLANTANTNYIVSGLQPNTPYWFDIAARNASGTIWGAAAFATTYLQVAPTVNEPIATDIGHEASTTSTLSYVPVQGPLFGPNGPSYTDVHQSATLGDCWLLSSLSDAAARDQQAIRNMFTYKGDIMTSSGLVSYYAVTFYLNWGGNYNNQASTCNVMVDTRLPSGGSYCSGEYFDQPENGILWVALAEKAYVEASALGYVSVLPKASNSFAGENNYWAINGGWASYALHAITGHAAYDVTPMDAIGPDNSISYGMNNGYLECITTGPLTIPPTPVNTGGTFTGPVSSQIAITHVYAVISLQTNGNFTIMNPWGVNDPANPSDPANLYYSTTHFYALFPASECFIQSNWGCESFCKI